MHTHEDDEDGSPFGSIISRYTREMAIDDGTLVEVPRETTREVGIKFPVALTAAAWTECVEWPARLGTEQSESGRLWDVLWMMRGPMRAAQGSEVLFQLYVRAPGKEAPTLRTLKAVCGPGDDLEPVITVMLPEED